MIWLTGIICFAVGLCVGAVLFNYLKSDTAKVKQLEEKLEDLQQEHREYRQMVHSHFTTSAQLFLNLTDSYRDVYNHLARGAQSLCPDDISSQLTLFADNRDMLSELTPADTEQRKPREEEFSPPRDYATREGPNRKGNLAEDYGLEGGRNREESTSS